MLDRSLKCEFRGQVAFGIGVRVVYRFAFKFLGQDVVQVAGRGGAVGFATR